MCEIDYKSWSVLEFIRVKFRYKSVINLKRINFNIFNIKYFYIFRVNLLKLRTTEYHLIINVWPLNATTVPQPNIYS